MKKPSSRPAGAVRPFRSLGPADGSAPGGQPAAGRRRSLGLVGAAGAVVALGAMAHSAPVRAQGGPVRLMVGFAAGGSIDLLARALAEPMGQALGRPVIVENRVGAAGRLAIDAVRSARPDGDTLLVCPQGPLTLFPYVFRNLKYDPFKDLAPVTRLAIFDCAVSLGPQSGAQTLPAFLDWVKAHPNQGNFGSSGAGTLLHFIGVSIAQRSGVPLTHVPYKGSAPAVADLIGGNVPMVVTPMSDVLEQHKAGRLKIVAITSPERSRIAPDIATCRELGLDVEVPGWFALYGPAGMPDAVAENLNRIAGEALANAAIRERLLKMGMLPATVSRQRTRELQVAEHRMWEPMVKASGFTPED